MGSPSHAGLANGPVTETKLAGIRTHADIVAELKARLAREAWVSNRGIWTSAEHGVIAPFGMIGNEEE